MKPKKLKPKKATTPALTPIHGDGRRQDFLAIRYSAPKVESVAKVKKFLDDSINADDKLKSFVDTVSKNGHKLYLVGGSVRDVLMGKTPEDLDFVTDAHPDKVASMIESIGAKNVDVGKAFGVNVLVGKNDTYDIATFRKEEYGENDPHRPTNVEYLKTVEEDLSRRDFTINAMAYDVHNDKLIDVYGGKKDLESGIIKSVGNPKDRFQEDPLRILRAFRFASTMGFKIDKSIMDAIPEFVDNPKTNSLSRERVVAELGKTLMGKNPEIGLKAILDTGMNKIKMSIDKKGQDTIDFLPEISHLKDLQQNPEYHKYDALMHTLEVVKNSPHDLDVRYAALFHDAGKGLSHIRTFKDNGAPQDIGHQEESSKMTKSILDRFGFNQKRVKDIQFMVENHMKLLHDTTPKYMNRYLNDLKVGFSNKEDFKKAISNLMDLRTADVSGGLNMEGGTEKLKTMKTKLLDHLDSTALFASDLAINGNDVGTILGVKGKEIGEMLKEYVQRVQNGSVKNDRDSLIAALEKKRDRKLGKVKEGFSGLKLKPQNVIPWIEDFNSLSDDELKVYTQLLMSGYNYSVEENSLLTMYKNGDLNNILNALKNINFKVLERIQKSDDVIKPSDFITKMDNIINKESIKNDIVLYKIINSNFFKVINESLINMNFKDCGYFSASLTDKIFKNYIENTNNPVLIKVRVPKNVNGIYIENGIDVYDNEVILPRGCVFKIIAVDDDIIYNTVTKVITTSLVNITSF